MQLIFQQRRRKQQRNKIDFILSGEKYYRDILNNRKELVVFEEHWEKMRDRANGHLREEFSGNGSSFGETGIARVQME